VASVPAAAQWLRELGGDLIEVDLLLPPGASPHLWQPTVTTMRTLAQADLRVVVGGGMEPWAGQILRAAGPSRHDLALIEWLEDEGLLEVPAVADPRDGGSAHGHGFDPHVWLSPSLAQEMCRGLTHVLCELAPDHREALAVRGEEYQARLAALVDECARWRSRLGPRRIVTFHRAWDHLAAALDLEVAAVIASTPGVEPSARKMRELIALVRAGDVEAVIAEPQFNTGIARILAGEAGVPLVILDPLGREDQSYEAMIRGFLTRIEETLAHATP
jgi:ABC-type Zn uptake system ZnuABC Zn-binding protein ZnuA